MMEDISQESVTVRTPLTQEEFDRFRIAVMECYSDSWYSDQVLMAVADTYGFNYESEYYG